VSQDKYVIIVFKYYIIKIIYTHTHTHTHTHAHTHTHTHTHRTNKHYEFYLTYDVHKKYFYANYQKIFIYTEFLFNLLL